MSAADVTAIVSGVDYATILTGVGAIGAAAVVVIVAMKGVKMLFGTVKSA